MRLTPPVCQQVNNPYPIGVPRGASGANAGQLTPGSGPLRTPWRGAAGSDANSPGLSRLPRVRVQITSQTPPAQAVEVAPDAHGGQRRLSCVRVCCRTRAPCAALRAAPRTGLHIFATTLNLLRSRLNITAPKLMSPHFNLLKCRRLGTAATTDVQSALVRPPRRLPDSEVSDAPRAYHAADGGAPTRTSWEQFF
ncbi:hypothetical protein EVAR_14073_1 [Eumeta japonica]|uniref:Uncharacterized protein n=1 Tax=Eumeta variegata TaxID=151549 RepID=A0A4C1UPW5_EUMVA|nr:hypothetical protein EVAR_14073_1 [Eumeta japonica]